MTIQISSYFLRITYTVFLASGGIFINSAYRRFELPYSLFFTIWMLTAILGSVIGFANFPTIENRIEVLIQISSHLFMLALHWAIKYNRVRLLTFSGYLNVQACPEYVGSEAVHLTERLFKKFMFVMTLFVLFMFMVCFISLVTPFLVDLNFKDSSIYVMPFWFMCDKTGKRRFLVSFLCFNVDRKSKFVLMNMAQTTVFVIEMSSYVTSFAFYAIFQTFVKAHVTIMEEKIANMSAMAKNQHAIPEENEMLKVGNKYERLRKIGYDDIMYAGMLNIIKYQRYLHG